MIQRIARLAAIACFGIAGWGGAAVITAGSAAACAVTPGMSCAPDQLTISPSATLVATKTNTISSNPNDYSATYTENVYRDPNNGLCSFAGQCLTWAIEVTMHSTSQDTLTSVSVSNFSGFSTDIGYTPPPTGAPGMANPNGGVVPSQVDRSNNGSVLEWFFSNPEVGDGQTTVLLVLQTSATQVVPGTISTQDGTAASDPAYGPALPEVGWVPAVGLVGGVVAGGALFRRRRTRTSR